MLAVAAITVATPAISLDWRISGFFSQRLSADTNLAFDEDDNGAGTIDGVSSTDLGVTFSGTTPRTQVAVSPGVRLSLSTDDDFDITRISPRLNASVQHQRPATAYTARVGVTPRFTNTLDIIENPVGEDLAGESIFVDSNAFQLRSTASFGVSHRFTPLVSGSLGFSVVDSRILDDGGDGDLQDTLSFGGNAGLSRGLTPRLSGSVSTSLRRFDSEDGGRTDTASFSGGLNWRAAQRVTIGFRAGVSYFDSLDVAANGSESRDSGLTFNGGFNLNVGDFDTEDTTVRLFLNQDVRQNDFGDVTESFAAGVSVRNALTQRANLTTNLTFRADNPVFSGATDQSSGVGVGFGPSLRYALGDDWSLRSGYRFNGRRNDDGGVTTSHAVFLQLSRGFDILP